VNNSGLDAIIWDSDFDGRMDSLHYEDTSLTYPEPTESFVEDNLTSETVLDNNYLADDSHLEDFDFG